MARATWTRHAVVALVAVAVVIALENAVVAAWFPRLTRLVSDFSPAYLRRELAAERAGPPPTVFLGDSVLWGYRLAPEQTAVALLAAQGCACRNLAFKTGNPPNDSALARLVLASGVRPRAVVVEVNQALDNESNPNYRTLHPAVATLAGGLLNARDRAVLDVAPPAPPAQAWLDRALSAVSPPYAMRSDLRETVLGEPPLPPLGPLTAQTFDGTYDLVPLTDRNIGVAYLVRTAGVLRAAGVPVLAFLTPVNHALLHADIDNRLYRDNAAFLARALRARGARVLDLDAALPQIDFIDNAHLTAAGQQRLAALLGRALDALPSPSQR